MATSLRDNLSDEIINIKCCLCAQDNRVREADRYCVQCMDYYCASCIEIHKKIPGTKNHQLLDKSDFRSLGSDGSLPSLPTQRCALHPAKVMDVFCRDHNEVACASCMIISHRTCTNVINIPEEIDSLYSSTEPTNAKQKIYKTKTTMEEIKKEKERQIKELKEAFDKEVTSVRTFRQELQTLLDNMEQKTVQELKKDYDRLEASLVEEIKNIKKLIDDVNEVSSQLRKSEGNKSQEFICVKSLEKVTAKAENVEKKRQQQTGQTVSFMADQNIETVFQQIQVLGKVSCKKLNGLYKVKQHREIYVKLADDSYKDDYWGECRIMGSCMTADGTLLLTDNNNKKLKHLDLNTGTIKDYIKFQADPFAVCLVNKTEAALTLDNKTVQFVSLGNKLTASCTLTMNHECFGLDHKGGKLFISNGKNTVFIHDMNGRELHRISKDAFGKEIVQTTRCLTLNADKDRVLVADYHKGLVFLNTEGNYLSTLTDPSLSGIQAVCTDGRHFFVCGYISDNIVQIGLDNKLLGELVKVKSPLSLCFDPVSTRLIITQFKTNTITVIDLEQM